MGVLHGLGVCEVWRSGGGLFLRGTVAAGSGLPAPSDGLRSGTDRPTDRPLRCAAALCSAGCCWPQHVMPSRTLRQNKLPSSQCGDLQVGGEVHWLDENRGQADPTFSVFSTLATFPVLTRTDVHDVALIHSFIQKKKRRRVGTTKTFIAR